MSNQPVYRTRNHAYLCKCPGCEQAGAYSANLFKGGCLLPVGICAVIAGVVWVVSVPLRFWHTTGADGQQHPDAATWIAYGTGGAEVPRLGVGSCCSGAGPAGLAGTRSGWGS